VEYGVDLEERVEVVVTEAAVVLFEMVCDRAEGVEREIRRRHRGGVGVGLVERKLARRVANNQSTLAENCAAAAASCENVRLG
jgi:hypothetical protein